MAVEGRGADAPAEVKAGRSNGRAAIGAYLASSWRARWRSLAVLTLLIALTGGATLAAGVGARRSATSLERFADEARTLDLFVAADVTSPEPAALRALLDGPLVEESNDLVFLMVDDSIAGVFFAPTSRSGLDLERGVLLEGRRPDPDDPHEIVLTDITSEEFGLGVGDTFDLPTITPEQTAAMFATGREPTSADGPQPRMRVVGIVRNGFALVGSPGNAGLNITTPAFMDEYGAGIGVGSTSHMVRLADTPEALERFTDGVAAAYGDEHLPSINVGQGEATVNDAISIGTAALIAVALVIAVAGIAWVVAGVARHQRGASLDIEVLRALGSTPAQRRGLLVGMVAPALLAGPVTAVPVAIALSPLFPVGTARRLDPGPGLHADWTALLAGAAVLAVVVAIAAVASAWRSVGRSGSAVPTPNLSRLVDRAARSLPPAPATGMRFALHGRRRVAAPVRPALAGAVVGVVGLVAVAVVGSSMQRLVDTPARWGTTWDAAIAAPPPQLEGEFEPTLAPEDTLDDADIDAAAVLLHDEQVTINGVEAITMTFHPVKGDLGPTVVDGRAPLAPDEIALGRDTLDAVGVPLGATVTVGSRAGAEERFRVVGAIAFPTVGSPSAVAAGAALTAEGGERLLLGDPNRSDDVGTAYLAVRWAPGIDEEAALARWTEGGQAPVVLPTLPPEVEGLSDVRGFPLVAAAALVVLGVVATIHALIVTVRRRRHELGVLSALGFTPSMRAGVVAAQATTLAGAALLVGVPLGLLLGRATWAAIAANMGLAADPMTPPVLLFAAGAAGLVLLLNAIAAVPGRSAYRLRAGEALRTE